MLFFNGNCIRASMVKLVDTRDLKSLAERCAGSTPATRTKFGSLAQLVERLPYTQNVGSSRLSRPTIQGDAVCQVKKR